MVRIGANLLEVKDGFGTVDGQVPDGIHAIVPLAEYQRLVDRADLAESYYILGQMPHRYAGWCNERYYWMKAFEATIEPDPPAPLPDWPEGWFAL